MLLLDIDHGLRSIIGLEPYPIVQTIRSPEDLNCLLDVERGTFPGGPIKSIFLDSLSTFDTLLLRWQSKKSPKPFSQFQELLIPTGKLSPDFSQGDYLKVQNLLISFLDDLGGLGLPIFCSSHVSEAEGRLVPVLSGKKSLTVPGQFDNIWLLGRSPEGEPRLQIHNPAMGMRTRLSFGKKFPVIPMELTPDPEALLEYL
jgi:hypothetical protein